MATVVSVAGHADCQCEAGWNIDVEDLFIPMATTRCGMRVHACHCRTNVRAGHCGQIYGCAARVLWLVAGSVRMDMVDL
eukprot:4246457-Pyramimonas_sp.AAC.1